jgi:vesicle-associated membrane protein 7
MLYALVSRGPTILAEHASTAGNFASIAIQIIPKINDVKCTFQHDRYYFHTMTQDGCVFMVVAFQEFGRRIPFEFLTDVAAKFKLKYGSRAQTAESYALNDFHSVLEQQMIFFSNNDKFHQVRGEIESVKEVMVTNIEKVLERGEALEILVDKTDNLNQASFAFKKRSTALRRAMWWKNTKLVVIMIAGSIFGLYFLVGYFCGLPGWKSCLVSFRSSI